MKVDTLHIHVQWSGPHSYAEAKKLRDSHTDFGVYQIYGSHPVYGSDVLIYIGKAEQQTFGKRLSQERWENYNQDSSRLAVYVGRISGYEGTPDNDTWAHHISQVERLLIFSHWPAGNSSGLNVNFGQDLYAVHILNWGQYRDLLPEVSGTRYSNRYWQSEGYSPHGESLKADI